MLEDLTFCSLDSVPLLTHPEHTAIISILDAQEARSRPDLSAFAHSLILTFEDASEANSFCDTPWPLSMTLEQAHQHSSHRSERVMILDDAQAIVAFFAHVHHHTDCRHLVVHCFAGVCRSVAVALALSVRFGVPLNTSHSTEFANPWVLRLMHHAVDLFLEPRL